MRAPAAVVMGGLVAVVAALSGCTAGGPAELRFDGQGNGTHAVATPCGSDARLAASGNVDAGALSIRVWDGMGTEVHVHGYDGSFDFAGQGLLGAAGTWSVGATRTGAPAGPFEGTYSVTLRC